MLILFIPFIVSIALVLIVDPKIRAEKKDLRVLDAIGNRIADFLFAHKAFPLHLKILYAMSAFSTALALMAILAASAGPAQGAEFFTNTSTILQNAYDVLIRVWQRTIIQLLTTIHFLIP